MARCLTRSVLLERNPTECRITGEPAIPDSLLRLAHLPLGSAGCFRVTRLPAPAVKTPVPGGDFDAPSVYHIECTGEAKVAAPSFLGPKTNVLSAKFMTGIVPHSFTSNESRLKSMTRNVDMTKRISARPKGRFKCASRCRHWQAGLALGYGSMLRSIASHLGIAKGRRAPGCDPHR